MRSPRFVGIDNRYLGIRTAPNTGSCVLKSCRLLAGESPVLVTNRRPGIRQPVHLGDRVC